MRISGGEAKGVRLAVPAGVRPASERVRQAVFSSVAARVPGARVLDLFCGSGAYGLEALSRGAAGAVLVDSDPDALRAARANARTAGFAQRVRLLKRDARRYGGDGGPFDLAFADPPYEMADAIATVLDPLRDALTPDGLVVIETRRGPDETTPTGYLLEADRRYGDTRVRMYLRHDPGEAR